MIFKLSGDPWALYHPGVVTHFLSTQGYSKLPIFLGPPLHFCPKPYFDKNSYFSEKIAISNMNNLNYFIFQHTFTSAEKETLMQIWSKPSTWILAVKISFLFWNAVLLVTVPIS